MECNKDEAIRAKEIAERKVNEKDYAGAKKFALKAHNLFPTLDGITQMMATLDVYLASETNVNGEKDLYAVLCVNSLADEETVKKQYRKLALLLHPDKNKSAGAEGAFQLVSEAWSVLSDRTKKYLYDQKISLKKLQQKSSQSNKNSSAPNSAINGFYQFANGPTAKVWPQQGIPQRPPPAASPTCHPQPPTFWTSCAGCCMQYEYHRMYLNKSLLCPKCRKPFQAKELPAPPSIPHPPKASSQQNNLSNKYKNPNRSSTAPPTMGATGFQHGMNANSFSESKVQWSPFSGAATAAGVNSSSAAVAQAANVVQKAYEKAKRQREEVQAAARREEALRRKFNVSKGHADTCANIYVGPTADKAVNLTRDIRDDARSNCGQNHNNQSVGANRNSNEGENEGVISGDSFKSKLNLRQMVFNREFAQADIRSLLIEKAKRGILRKIGELKSVEASKAIKKNMEKKKQNPKYDIKESKKFSEEIPKFTVIEESMEKEVTDSSGHNREVLQKELLLNDSSDDSDKEDNQPVSIDVPDADFHVFDNDRTEKTFGGDQIWATYDDDDGMPRYYALIQKVISTKPFKVRMSFLTSKSNAEFSQLDWVSSGFTKICGDFRVGRYEVCDSINIFSHRVKWEKGFRGVIKILPKKGDTWALYRNWTPCWDEHTPDEVIHKYDMVEILEDYNEDQGVLVVPLVKLAGFKTVFQRHMDPSRVKQIPKHEIFRLSHQVPCHMLTGDEASNAPKGCVELDPAATPLELLQVATAANNEELINDAKQQPGSLS